MNSYIWIHILMNSYKNSESIHLNSYTWIHILMNSYIHFTYEFTCIWIHIIISYMNSYNDFMNSYVYEFTYMWNHIFIHIWIHINYEFICFFHIWVHMLHKFIYEFGCTKVPDSDGQDQLPDPTCRRSDNESGPGPLQVAGWPGQHWDGLPGRAFSEVAAGGDAIH